MSTRSCLAYKTKDGWSGTYCHWDGYPTNRGKQIWEILMRDFVLNRGKLGVANKGDTALKAFVEIYIKGHKGGWSAFPKECYCHSAEFVMRDGAKNDAPLMTNKTVDPLFIEWVYVIDIENKKLIIYTGVRAEGEHEESVTDKKTKEIRKWESPNYKHYLVCEVDINPDAKEPDWEAIEKKGNDISNEMSDKYEPKKEVKSGKS